MNQALKAFAVAAALVPGISAAQTITYTAPNGIVYISPTQTTFTRLAVSTVPVSSAGAVNVLVAGAISNGCEIQNIGTTPLHFTLAVTVATLQDIMLFPGQSFVCPHPTTAALSVINDSNATIGQIAGYAF